MSDKDTSVEIPASAGHPLSGIILPLDVFFSDDTEGLEARMLIAGYADRLADLTREHAPIQTIRDTVGKLIKITQAASYREICKLASTTKAN